MLAFGHLSRAAEEQVDHRKRQAQVDMQDPAGLGRGQEKGAVVGDVGKAGEKVAIGQLFDRDQRDLKFVAQIGSNSAGQIAGESFVQLADAVQLLFAQKPSLMQVPGLDLSGFGTGGLLPGVALRGPKQGVDLSLA